MVGLAFKVKMYMGPQPENRNRLSVMQHADSAQRRAHTSGLSSLCVYSLNFRPFVLQIW